MNSNQIVISQNSKSISFGLKLTMVLMSITVSFTSLGYNTETVSGIQWNYVIDSAGKCILGTTTATASYEAGSPMPAVSSGTSGDAVVPQKLGGKNVNIIGYGAFSHSHLSSLTIPNTVTEIRGAASYMSTFYDTSIRKLIFNGNAPKIDAFANNNVGLNRDCIVYVMPSSTGWGVQIPGTWKGREIRYLKSVDFDVNGGVVSTTTRWLTDGSAVGTLPTPTRTGYTFDGWYTAASGGAKISASTTVSTDTIYYAHWTVNKYTITFNANGGTGGISKKINFASTLGTLPTPTRDDYDFGGWFTSASGGTQVTTTATVTGDATYYAHWIDPIPELADGATDANVANAIEGSADANLYDKITNIVAYTSYRQWVVDRGLAHKIVKASPNAWLSYALDAPGLMARTTSLAGEDIEIESLKPASSSVGTFDLMIGINGVEISKGARLSEALGIVGSATLDGSPFTSDGLTVSLECTADGKAKATVTPDGMPRSFFLRVKVK